MSMSILLRKRCPYLELFWSTFFHIRSEYGEIWSISPYSAQMRENADQNNSEYSHFSCRVYKSSKISNVKEDFLFCKKRNQSLLGIILFSTTMSTNCFETAGNKLTVQLFFVSEGLFFLSIRVMSPNFKY